MKAAACGAAGVCILPAALPTPRVTDFDLDAYDFSLPADLIAQRPPERRDGARMLVLDRATGRLDDRLFADLPAFVRPHDVVVTNDTRVVPARLVGARAGGGKAELFLVRRIGLGLWDCLARPGRKLRQDARVTLDGGLAAHIESVDETTGHRRVRFTRGGAPFADAAEETAVLDAAGQMPLPPYVDRERPEAADRERYQTVFARERGAGAAPTAGLHFTPETFERLAAAGAAHASVTLHVGYGTFEPVHALDLREHAVAAEDVEVSDAAAEAVRVARAAGGRVLAVGTTTTRALETAAASGAVAPFRGPTELTVTPGYRFRAVDALLTNFHLPKSSLLVLVSAFAGREATLDAYRHAVAARYRFYSYGDCMLIV